MIITLADYKSYAGLVNPKGDDKLSFIVDFVNSYIVNYCGCNFEFNSVIGERNSSYNGLEIILDNVPIIEVIDLIIDGNPIDPRNYVVDKASGVIEAVTSFPTTRFGVEVDYEHGHETVPLDLKLCALEFVTHLHKREFTKSRNLGNGEAAQYGDPELIPPHIRIGLSIHKVL